MRYFETENIKIEIVSPKESKFNRREVWAKFKYPICSWAKSPKTERDSIHLLFRTMSYLVDKEIKNLTEIYDTKGVTTMAKAKKTKKTAKKTTKKKD